jgi:proteasome lid subunit RPN8/RPN11
VPTAIEVLHLPRELAARVHEEARQEYPAEACGFLLGSVAGKLATVRRVRPEANRATRRDRFLIDAEDVFAALQAGRATGDEIVGVYHSHPDAGSAPSATDRREAWGEWLQLIVACERGSVTGTSCWRSDGDRLVAVAVIEEAA